MRHFLPIAAGVDVAPVLAELDAQPELWDQITLRKTAQGGPHSRMSDIWLRYNDVRKFGPETYGRMADEHVPIWYPAWRRLPALHPILFRLMAAVQGEAIGLVLITRIPPGAGIDRHADYGWHCDYHRKFYLSLRSAPGAVFGCEHDGATEELHPKPGEIWLFDNHKPHWVRNDSDRDRITAIICIHTEKYDVWHEQGLRAAA